MLPRVPRSGLDRITILRGGPIRDLVIGSDGQASTIAVQKNKGPQKVGE